MSNFDLIWEKYLADLNNAIVNRKCESEFNISQDKCEIAFGKFNQLQYFLIPAILNYFVDIGELDESRRNDSMESKMMWMMSNSNAAKKLRDFANLTTDFDKIFGVDNVNELVEFLLQYPKDYDIWHAKFLNNGEKYKNIAKNLISAMMDDPNYKISIW